MTINTETLFINTKHFQNALKHCDKKPSTQLSNRDLILFVLNHQNDTSSKLSKKQIKYILDLQRVIHEHEGVTDPLTNYILEQCTQNIIKGLLGHLKSRYRLYNPPTEKQINFVLQHDQSRSKEDLLKLSQFRVSKIIQNIKTHQ